MVCVDDLVNPALLNPFTCVKGTLPVALPDDGFTTNKAERFAPTPTPLPDFDASAAEYVDLESRVACDCHY
jgi:hypothetical protein